MLKKEIAAIALLAVILGCTIGNIFIVRHYTKHINHMIDEIQVHAENKKWDEAIKAAENAEQYWHKKSHYTHIVMRHSEINQTTLIFCQFLAEVYRNDLGGVKGMGKALKEQIHSMYDMETIYIGTMF